MSEEQEYELSFAQATQEYSTGIDVGHIPGFEGISRAMQTPVQRFIEVSRQYYPDHITDEEKYELEQRITNIPDIENRNPKITVFAVLWRIRKLDLEEDFQKYISTMSLKEDQLDLLRYIRFVSRLKI